MSNWLLCFRFPNQSEFSEFSSLLQNWENQGFISHFDRKEKVSSFAVVVPHLSECRLFLSRTIACYSQPVSGPRPSSLFSRRAYCQVLVSHDLRCFFQALEAVCFLNLQDFFLPLFQAVLIAVDYHQTARFSEGAISLLLCCSLSGGASFCSALQENL